MRINFIIRCLVAWLILVHLSPELTAQNHYVLSKKEKNNFALSVSGKSTPLYVSQNDFPGVIRALKDLQADIRNVTNAQPVLSIDATPSGQEVVIVGTIGKSTLIDQLVSNKKLSVSDLTGKWETFVIEVIENPLPNVARALVIAGSDKRGTIFGIYDVSKQIGVSPWYWWADVPPKKNSSLFVKPGRYVQGAPAVKYRGIFINDEEPAMGRWAVEKYGGFKHELYEKVFELILRLKGNYLWPAMWWASFNSDDILNPQLADEYGIVIGTTHHEPMMRAHAEWKTFGGGEWNYETNSDKLQRFWTEGIQRMGSRESIVSLGMRGDGDKAMTAETNIALLEKIVADQRKILAEVSGKEVTAVPQLWALYKEVQDYYDNGMRVPDDVTLLLCDDNWGNIRKLPKPGDTPRSGSYGIYYHFDYVGGPRNYKWLNTNPISRTREQMNLALAYGANRIWIVNVGDIKPMEFPTEFFLDFAWNPEQLTPDKLQEYTEQWAARQFDTKYAKEIATILSKYTKFNGRRKPELLSPETYSQSNYREAETIVAEYNKITSQAERIYNVLPSEYKNAFYQLVLFPVKASANLNELFITVGRNRWYARQGRAATNDLAFKAKTLFAKDAELANYYNKQLSDGKWNHMMGQTHISYTYWQQPQKDVMPEVKEIEIPSLAEMGVTPEGSENWWPLEKSEASLPEFDNYTQQTYYIDIFNRGQLPFIATAKSEKKWLHISQEKSKVEKEQRLWISVDWSEVPLGTHQVPITITGPNDGRVIVHTVISNPAFPKRNEAAGFVESNGYISMEAEHYTQAVNTKLIQWQTLPDLGRTSSGVTPIPVTTESQTPGENSPRLEYQVHLFNSGEVKVNAYFSPTLNFQNTGGLRYAISFDDEAPQITNLHEDKTNKAWEQWVSDNVIVKTSKHILKQPREHVLKFWMVDSGVVLQKLVIETKPIPSSYLGPPESFSTHKK